MKRAFSVVALLLSLLFAFGPAVSAQTPVPENFGEIGIESGYGRTFAKLEIMQMGEQNPDATPDPATFPLGVVISVMQFADANVLAESFAPVSERMLDGMNTNDYVEGQYELHPIDGLGEEAFETVGEADMNGVVLPVTWVYARQGAYIFSSTTMGSESSELDQKIVRFMLDAEPSDTPVELHEDGTSTGGAFDMMPTVDDIDGMNGMQPIVDEDMLG